MKNSFGMDIHPTDYLIHWRDKKPEETAAKLRVAYDFVVGQGAETQLKVLLDAARREGYEDGYSDGQNDS